jgi:hypothetical protein
MKIRKCEMENNIPIISYPEVDTVDEALEYLDRDEELKFNRILEAIENVYLSRSEYVDLFRLNIKNSMGYTMRCYKEEWNASLEKCLKYFERTENFENCSKIKKIKEVLNGK